MNSTVTVITTGIGFPFSSAGVKRQLRTAVSAASSSIGIRAKDARADDVTRRVDGRLEATAARSAIR